MIKHITKTLQNKHRPTTEHVQKCATDNRLI